MNSRALKAAFYSIFKIPMRINGIVYKGFRSPSGGLAKVHLGPGQKNYLPGWINVDANLFTAKIDVWANLCDPLPFRNDSVDVFYSHHVIEHLPDSFLLTHCKDLLRCLKPGGAVRIGGPNGDSAVRKLLEGDCSWFSDFPDARKSIGGKFANFILCRGEHLTILTFSYLAELFSDAGFINIRQCRPISETYYPQFIDQGVLSKEWESTPDTPHTLIIEAQKPATV